MRLTLVHNPTAGDGSHRGGKLVKLLEKSGHDVTRWSTKEGIDEAFEDPGDAVVAAGGDGTVRKCAVRLAGRGVPLAVLPLGNANNVAKSLELLAPLRDVAAGLEDHARRSVDLGTARVGSRRLPFLESVGGGLVTSLIREGSRRVEGALSEPGNEIDRALMVLRGLVARAPARHWGVGVDGEDVSGRYLGVEALNVGLVGPNLALAQDVDPGDGRLDVVLLRTSHRRRLLAHVEDRLAGRGAPLELPVLRGRRVTLRVPAGALHVDDEAVETDGAAEVTLTLRRGALTILKPRGSAATRP